MIQFEDSKMNDLLEIHKKEIILKEKDKLEELKQKLEHKLDDVIRYETEKLKKMKHLQKILMAELDFNKQISIKKSISQVCELITKLNTTIDEYKNEIYEIKNDFENLDKRLIKFETIADFIANIITNNSYIKEFKILAKYINKYFQYLTKQIDDKIISCSMYCVFEDKSKLEIIFKINIHPDLNIEDLNLHKIKVTKNPNENLDFLVFRLNENLEWEYFEPLTNISKKDYHLSHLIKWAIEQLEQKLLDEKRM